MDEDDLTAVKDEIYLNRKWLLISVIFPYFAYWQVICNLAAIVIRQNHYSCVFYFTTILLPYLRLDTQV
jgi:hypothetical protein